MTDQEEDIWPTRAQRAAAALQAARLRAAAEAGGLRFEAYLPPDLAIWLLDRIAAGDFHDPSEAAFVLLGESKELEPHADLRRELLKRSLDIAKDGPTYPAEEVFAMLEQKFSGPRPEPARWIAEKHEEKDGSEGETRVAGSTAGLTDAEMAGIRASATPPEHDYDYREDLPEAPASDAGAKS